MKRTIAFLANTGSDFHRTARSARFAEFKALLAKLNQMLPRETEIPVDELARNLTGTIYPAAIDAFIAAARYLEQYRGVLTGAELDPEERKDDE